MVLIPDNTNTTQHVIEDAHKIKTVPRTYLGMSSLGGECMRRQWYAWRWARIGEITVRVQRLFNRGHLEEASIITDLVGAGMEVFRLTKKGKEIPMTGAVGEKQETIEGFHKHCFGHPDGRVRGVIEAPKTVHLLEMKTMNDKYFQMLREAIEKQKQSKERRPAIQNSRALKKSFPEYFGQMTKYMGELGLTRGLFVATNKNDQARKYLRVHFDDKLFQKLKEREQNIILSDGPPPKRYKPTHYLCAWCGMHQICHLDAVPARNCRTCNLVDVMPKGKWQCSKTGKNLSERKQRRGCDSYTRLF